MIGHYPARDGVDPKRTRKCLIEECFLDLYAWASIRLRVATILSLVPAPGRCVMCIHCQIDLLTECWATQHHRLPMVGGAAR